MLEACEVRAALMAEFSRVRSVPENNSESILPRASASDCPVADSIHLFQRVTRCLPSSPTRPPLIAFSTAFWCESPSAAMGMDDSCLARCPFDERAEQILQGCKRRQVEQHRQVALNF